MFWECPWDDYKTNRILKQADPEAFPKTEVLGKPPRAYYFFYLAL
jgi:hypothetical protein